MEDITVLYHKDINGLYIAIVKNAHGEVIFTDSNFSTFRLANKQVDKFLRRMQ